MPSAREKLHALVRLEPAGDATSARLGLALWCVVFLFVAVYSAASILKNPGGVVPHSVSPVYWKAAHQWWHSEEMYGSREPTQEGRHGFLYLPQAAVLFTPLALLPTIAAEILWRLLGLSGVACALWRLAGVLAPDRRLLWFGLGSFLAMPATLLSTQNGQCNLVIVAIMTLGTVAMMERRWWRAAWWLALGLAFKPHVLVLILLVGVLQPPMRPRLLVTLAAVAALPWINPDWGYVWQEHLSFVEKMRVAGKPPPGTEQDIVTLVYSLGAQLPERAWLVIRVAGAGAVSLLALLATLRFERATALFYVLTLSVLYIMIFNPRTEGPTHAMMGLPLTVLALDALTRRQRPIGWALAAVCVLLGTSHELIHPINRWMQPTLELWIGAYVAWQILTSRPIAAPRPESGPGERVRLRSLLSVRS
jgi:hypothetical protein